MDQPVGDDLDESRMTLLEHLQELRKRLRNAALVLAGASLVASFFSWSFFQFLARPVGRALEQLGQVPEIVWIIQRRGRRPDSPLLLLLALWSTRRMVSAR
jgi:Sec-independent protein secretion pathway component TatC